MTADGADFLDGGGRFPAIRAVRVIRGELFVCRRMLSSCREMPSGHRGVLFFFRDILLGNRDALFSSRDGMSGHRDAMFGNRDGMFFYRGMIISSRDGPFSIRGAQLSSRIEGKCSVMAFSGLRLPKSSAADAGFELGDYSE